MGSSLYKLQPILYILIALVGEIAADFHGNTSNLEESMNVGIVVAMKTPVHFEYDQKSMGTAFCASVPGLTLSSKCEVFLSKFPGLLSKS